MEKLFQNDHRHKRRNVLVWSPVFDPLVEAINNQSETLFSFFSFSFLSFLRTTNESFLAFFTSARIFLYGVTGCKETQITAS